ncbi:unnamed protein product [Allacma fusca]|uniref:Monocarboxylate transporter n=1 Tax=Allacma fusca TaxID=39272 RepID=A0A8J2L7F7_9HEXA|nr:unnamed protein product [Allacma fusca]
MRFVQHVAKRMSGQINSAQDNKADGTHSGNFLEHLSRRMSGHPDPTEENRPTDDFLQTVSRRMSGHRKITRDSYDFTPEDAKILGMGTGPVMIHGADAEEILPEDIIVAPDGGWGWMIVLGTSFAEAGITVSPSNIGWIMSLLNGFYALGGPVAATLANRYGFRVAATIGSVLASSGFVLTYLFCLSKPNLIALYLCNGIMGGLGCSLLYVSSVISVGFYFEKHRAMSTGICVCGAGLGQTVFGTVFFYFLNTFGWKVSLLIEAGLFLSCSFCASLYRPLEVHHFPISGGIEEFKETTPLETVKSSMTAANLLASSTATLPGTAKEGLQNDGDSRNSVWEARVGHTLMTVDEFTGKREIYNISDIKTINSPLFRDDIFLRGTMRRIPAYAETVETGAITSAEWSVIVTTDKEEPGAGKKKCGGTYMKSLHLLLGGSIIASPSFLIILTACSLIGMGLYIPFAYLGGIALEKGLQETDIPVLFTVMGAANTAGRVMCGVVADLPKVRAELLLAIALCIGGAACVVLPLFQSYWLFIFYTVVFGFCIAFFFSLLSVVLADLMGLDNLTNAFGIMGMFLGIFTLVGTPFAGFLYEATTNYDLSFHVAGSMITLSGAVMFPVRLVNRWEKKRKAPHRQRRLYHPYIAGTCIYLKIIIVTYKKSVEICA